MLLKKCNNRQEAVTEGFVEVRNKMVHRYCPVISEGGQSDGACPPSVISLFIMGLPRQLKCTSSLDLKASAESQTA